MFGLHTQRGKAQSKLRLELAHRVALLAALPGPGFGFGQGGAGLLAGRPCAGQQALRIGLTADKPLQPLRFRGYGGLQA